MFNSENRLLVQARSGRWLPPVWVVIPLAFLMPLISSLGGAPALVFNVMRRVANPADLSGADAATIMRLMFPQTPLEQVVYLTTSFGGVFVLLWLWVALVEKRPFRSLGLAGKGAAARFGLGLAGGGLAFGSVVGLLYLAGGVTAGAEFWQPEAVAGGVLVLFGWLVQGPAEELVFRGWMLPVVSARYGVWPGALLSAATFAALHSFNPGLGVVAALNLGLFGLFAALYALREGGVWGVFGFHAVWNWAQGNVFGLAVSGVSSTGGSFITLQENGPAWLTGGAFGPEGGVVVTLLLGLATGALVWLGRRQKKPAEPGA